MSTERQSLGQRVKNLLRRGQPQQREVLPTVTTESSPKLVLEPVPAVDIPRVISPATLAEATLGVMKRHKQGQDRSRPAHDLTHRYSDEYGATLAREEVVELPAWNLYPRGIVLPNTHVTVLSYYNTEADGTQKLKVEPYDEDARKRWETYSFTAKSDGNIQVVYDQRWSRSDVPNHYTVDLTRGEGADWSMSATKSFRGKEGSTRVDSDEMAQDLFFRMNHYLQMAASGPASALVIVSPAKA